MITINKGDQITVLGFKCIVLFKCINKVRVRLEDGREFFVSYALIQKD